MEKIQPKIKEQVKTKKEFLESHGRYINHVRSFPFLKKPEASKQKLGEMKTNLSADLAVAVGAATAPPP